MKYKSAIGDGTFLGLMVYCMLTLAMYIFWVVSAIWWPAIMLTAVLVIGILPIYFGTKYELERDELRIYCGAFVRVVPYRSIVSITDADSVGAGFALSHKRICVRYLDGENIKITYISPIDRNAFRDALNTAMQKSIAGLKSKADIASIEAVEEAKERLAKEHELTRAEERAIKLAEEESKDRAKEDLAKEIKKLDDLIDGNIEPEDVVLSQAQEDKLYSRRQAERKLLAKVRKLKAKKDKAETRALLNKKNAEQNEQLVKAEEKQPEQSKEKVKEKPAAEPKQEKVAVSKEKKEEEKKEKPASKPVAKAEKQQAKSAKTAEKQEKKEEKATNKQVKQTIKEIRKQDKADAKTAKKDAAAKEKSKTNKPAKK